MKCMGCGAILQNTDKLKDGYTSKIDSKLCQRCFKIKNYGENIVNIKPINNEDIITKINKEKGFVIFLLDFLNIYEEVITTYKKIKLPKIIVLTKSDLIPKNILKNTLINNLKNIYHIKEDIIYTSSKNKDNINFIKDIIFQEKKVYFLGYTNSGKSSLINALANSDLTISKRSNTTLDFIKIKTNEGIIFDTPGFVPNNFLDNMLPKKMIRPIIYQLKNKYLLKINDYRISSRENNNLILYFTNDILISKRVKREELPKKIKVKENTDLIIKGLGFILIKKNTIISTDIPENLLEIRPTIIGGKHE